MAILEVILGNGLLYLLYFSGKSLADLNAVSKGKRRCTLPVVQVRKVLAHCKTNFCFFN